MSIAKKSWGNTGPMLPGMEISEQSESTTCQQLTLLPVDSLARTSALQENDQDFGKSFTVSFASYDHHSSSWKTWQLSLTGELIEFSETWPRAGMMQNGRCYQQQPLVRRISGNESLYWRTPVARDHHPSGGAYQPGKTIQLAHQVQRRPTPAARDFRGAGKKESYLVRRQSHQQSLNEEVVHGLHGQTGGQLNPTWVEWLMGYPLGWTDLKDSETPSCHKSQSTLDDAS